MQKYSIELVEEHPEVNFYSIKLNDCELTELERFFEKFPIGSDYDNDIDIIIAWLDKIGQTGALKRFFRNEGRYGDGVGAIPIEIGNKIRLYCLRLSDKILVFGNGDIKDTAKWQDSPKLSAYVELLMDTSRFIASRMNNGNIVLVEKEIVGNLNFTRDEKKQHH